MAVADYFDTVQKIYIAYYQRPADPAGLRYWAGIVDANGGDLSAVIDAFAGEAESAALYGEITEETIGDFLDSFYQALFNRAPDEAGKAFYTEAFINGDFTAAQIALAILDNAQNDDAVAVANKLQVSNSFTALVDGRPLTDPTFGQGTSFAATYAGDADAVAARAMLAAVTSDPATVKNDAQVLEFIQDSIADPGDQILDESSGQTFTLTVGVDSIVGTAGNDTILGVSEGKAGDTFNNLDEIDGSNGTDTLILTNASGTMTLPVGLTVENVENAVLRSAQNTVTADVSGWQGLTSVTVDQLGANENVSVTTGGNATSVAVVSGPAAGTGVVTILDSATTDTLASVSLNGNKGTATITSNALTSLSIANTNQDAVVVAAAGTRELGVTVNKVTGGVITDTTATSVMMTGSGAGSTGTTLTAANASTLMFAGDQSVSTALGAQKAGLVITSENAAGVTVTSTLNNDVAFTGGTGADKVTVAATTKTINMGEGDDTVEVTAALGAGGLLDGGEGTNTLMMASSVAAALSANDTFSKAVDNFQAVSLGQTAGGANDTVNLANLDDINYVKTAGTAAATGVAQVQTITVNTPADADGGVLKFAGVDITIPSLATQAQVAEAIAAQEAAIIVANPNVASVGFSGNVVQVTYVQFAAPEAVIIPADNASGVMFAPVVEINGTTEVTEQQEITVGGAPTATGVFTVGGVAVNVVLGESIAQTAVRIRDALDAAGFDVALTAPDVVTVTFEIGDGDVPDLAVVADPLLFGVAPTTAQSRAYVAPVAETQTVQITHGTDVDGGEIVVAGARIQLDGGLNIDQVGGVIASSVAAIQAANPGVAGVAYNTGDDKLTFTFTPAAGNVPPVVIQDNATTGVTASTSNFEGSAGTPGGMLNVTNMASNGTLEITGAINGASSVAVKDAGLTSSDVLNIRLNGASNVLNTAALTIAAVETINITTTDSNAKADPASISELILDVAAATKITLAGNHGVDFSGSTLTNMVEFDASGVVGTGATAAAAAAAGSVEIMTQVSDKSVSLKTGNGNDWVKASSITDATKSATIETGSGNDTAEGGAGNDTINLGEGNDWVWSSAGTDTITLGAGNDTYALWLPSDSTIDKRDVIADFQANTVGQGVGGEVTSAGALAAVADRTGDVIDLSWVTGINDVRVGVFSNAADAQTFVANGALDALARVNVALDSSTGFLYIDLIDNGVVDSVIELTGVTTIDAAAFVV